MSVSNHKRRLWIAALLSLLCTGLGHLYCGRLRRGLTLLLISVLTAPVALLAMRLPPSTAALTLFVTAALLPLALYVLAFLDSLRIAFGLRSGYELKDYNRPILYVVFIVMGLLLPAASVFLTRNLGAQAFKIPTRSMAPTIVPGDRVLVDKLGYVFADPERFDVVVFPNPKNRDQNFIKRIVGLPGDRVAIVGGQLMLNGKEVPRERDGADRPYRVIIGPSPQDDHPEVVVPPDRCFVLGDNRPGSKDSREFGCIRLTDLLGPVRYIFWSREGLRRFGPIDR
jgi:signal peptidase I